MKVRLKRLLCLLFTAHSATTIVSETLELPTVARCQRCGATVMFV